MFVIIFWFNLFIFIPLLVIEFHPFLPSPSWHSFYMPGSLSHPCLLFLLMFTPYFSSYMFLYYDWFNPVDKSFIFSTSSFIFIEIYVYSFISFICNLSYWNIYYCPLLFKLTCEYIICKINPWDWKYVISRQYNSGNHRVMMWSW